MAKYTIAQAIKEVLEEALDNDERVFLIGTDIGKHRGSFGTVGAEVDKYPGRIIEAPISECGFTGLALGAAYAGMKPIVELSFADFVGVIFEYMMNQATRNRYMTGMQEGGRDCGLIINVSNGAGTRGGAQHSQTVDQYLLPMPGLTVLAPAFPSDAKGLMKAALQGNDPVVFCMHKLILRMAFERPDNDGEIVPIGKAKVVKEGSDVTVVGSQLMLHRALEAAAGLENEGISAEVIDLRTIKPLDIDTILTSVRKTGRLVITNEGPTTGNIAAEIAFRISEEAFDALKVQPIRVCSPDTPIPFAPNLEDGWLVQADDIAVGIRKSLGVAK